MYLHDYLSQIKREKEKRKRLAIIAIPGELHYFHHLKGVANSINNLERKAITSIEQKQIILYYILLFILDKFLRPPKTCPRDAVKRFYPHHFILFFSSSLLLPIQRLFFLAQLFTLFSLSLSLS